MRTLHKNSTAEPGLKVVGDAKALFVDSAQTPGGIVKDHGKGRTVYLNMVLTDYHRWRMKPPEGEDLRAFLGDLFRKAGIKAQFPLADAGEGKYANIITEVHPFRSGDLRIVGLHRNYQIRTNELGPPEYQKQEALEGPVQVKVDFGGPCAVYDQRAGKFLGRQASLTVALDKHQPTILALLPEPVEKLTIEAPAEAAPGQLVQARFRLVGPKLGDVHVLRVALADPEGKELRMLTRNLPAPRGQAACDIPIAVSDGKGTYTLKVRDVPTGTTAEHKIQVK